MRILHSLTYILLLLCGCAYGQVNDYCYQRSLEEIKSDWHKIVLPDDVFSKVKGDLSDIRIIGITDANDTIEASYFLNVQRETSGQKHLEYKLLNKSKNDKGFYFTMGEVPNSIVNEIELDISQENFDWSVNLEGSNDQREWFTLTENYRILAIKNQQTNYRFTTITFPDAKYRYYRLLVPGSEEPKLQNARVLKNELTEASMVTHPVVSADVTHYKHNGQTTIHILLKYPVPVCDVRISVGTKYDYYRPIKIEYVTDSVKTEKGWQYFYSLLTSGTLSSLEKAEFRFNSTVAKKLRVTVDNYDNSPLQFDSFAIHGYVHELIVRFTEPAHYFLVYGNSKALSPQYDIARFTDKIPDSVDALTLGEEQHIKHKEVMTEDAKPLFQNKVWLWVVMTAIIILLGWFTLKMMRQK